ncbi:MAG: homoserine kinase [Aggregatilineales bacterium]
MIINARAEAFAPASMGNVGCGFDILGLAFCEPGDTVIVEPRDEPGAIMRAITGDNGLLPLDATQNTACVSANALLKQINAPCGVEITLKKDLPLASGLGSSAASAVAAVVAVNALFGEPLSKEALLPAALEGEALVSGYHADNAGPSLLGGITLITGTAIADIRRLPVPEKLCFALVTPRVGVKTSEARAVLPHKVPLHSMVYQTGAVARVIDALYRNDVEALAQAMESDIVVEPARAHLMPYLAEVRAAAKQMGAFSLVISGAGPTLCAVCNNEDTAHRVCVVMKQVYEEADIESDVRYTRVSKDGALVLSVTA